MYLTSLTSQPKSTCEYFIINITWRENMYYYMCNDNQPLHFVINKMHISLANENLKK